MTLGKYGYPYDIKKDDGYTYYSQMGSGWVISTNPKAEPERRWRAVHPQFGERFFKTHDEIPTFAVEFMRDMFYRKIYK
jgi:hypothetical protein